MNKRGFIARIYYTPCEICPISEYCKNCAAVSCGSTAAHYYSSHTKAKEGFTWPIKVEIKDL